MSEMQTSPLRTLRALRSVRQFRPDPVSDDVVQEILRVARWTGSARNQQPWELVVIRDRDTLARLAACSRTAAHLAGAAFGILLVMDASNAWQEFDAGRLAERLMLAAWAQGVGSCIGAFGDESRVRALLGIPQDRSVRVAISFGFPAALAGPPRSGTGRRPLEELVSYERYGSRVKSAGAPAAQSE